MPEDAFRPAVNPARTKIPACADPFFFSRRLPWRRGPNPPKALAAPAFRFHPAFRAFWGAILTPVRDARKRINRRSKPGGATRSIRRLHASPFAEQVHVPFSEPMRPDAGPFCVRNSACAPGPSLLKIRRADPQSQAAVLIRRSARSNRLSARFWPAFRFRPASGGLSLPLDSRAQAGRISRNQGCGTAAGRRF